MNDYLQRFAKPDDGASEKMQDISARSREIFSRIVDMYLETGSPVGSKSIAGMPDMVLSSASIRSIMAELETAGLLFQPHTSAGRLPTESGLRLFVDGLLEVSGDLSAEDRKRIDKLYPQARNIGLDRSVEELLEDTSAMLSGLSHCASLVLSPTDDVIIRHIEFVHLGDNRALVVLVTDTGQVENRLITLPAGLPSQALVEAGNFLSAQLAGHTLSEARGRLASEISQRQQQIDVLSRPVVDAGLAVWVDDGGGRGGSLILRGHANLLKDVAVQEDLENIRQLFTALEERQNTMQLLDAVNSGGGVQIFIGAENALFRHTGCSMIIAPWRDSNNLVLGAIGVIGPKHMNYARLIPMVNYASEAIGRLLARR